VSGSREEPLVKKFGSGSRTVHRLAEGTGIADLNNFEKHEGQLQMRTCLGAVLDLGEDLRRVGAAEHGQLPHGPVPVVVVGGRGRAAEANDIGVGNIRLVRRGKLLSKAQGQPEVHSHLGLMFTPPLTK
jgi:hypothetical protein